MNAIPIAIRPDPFGVRSAAEIPRRTPAERARYENAPGLDGDVPPRGPDPEPAGWRLPLIDTTAWIGREPDPQAWIVPGWLARGTAAMFVGEDGVGKSLLAQQLVTAVAAARPFMGLDVEQVPAVYITCEDSPNVLHMRQRAINRAIGLPVDCAPAMLSSLAGYTDVTLGAFDGEGVFQLSPAFLGIERMAKESGAGLIVLDNVAHLFVGNENIRQQVAAFCSALDRLAINCNAAVVMLAHPNKAGAEYSGSTGWSAHVRQRWFMERPEGGDRDARILRKSKANYSQAGVEIAFRWHEWAFVRDEDLGEDVARQLAHAARAAGDNGAFLDCLVERNRQQRAVSEKSGPNYAPSQFEGMPQAKGIGKQRLKAAMDRLFALGAIERGFLWRDTAEGRDIYGLCEAGPKASANAPANGPQTRSANDREQSPQTTATTHSPYYVREGGAANGPPPSYDPDDLEWDSCTGDDQ